jgi:hypothetical protein
VNTVHTSFPKASTCEYLRLRHKVERQLVAVRVHTVALQVVGAVQRALLGARHGVGAQRGVPRRAEVAVVVLVCVSASKETRFIS